MMLEKVSNLALCVLLLFVGGCHTDLVYRLKEEVQNGTLVGNVARDSKLYSSLNQEQLDNVQYKLTSANSPTQQVFTIHKTSGSITTIGRLDREQLCPASVSCILKLDVNVYIRDSKSSTFDLKVIPVEIVVEDINDNFPVFAQTHISLSVSEDVSVGHVSLITAATDKDTGKNNSIQSYQLLPDNGIFVLVEEQNLDGSVSLGIKVSKKLDRETQDFYGLRVIAKDGGNPPKTGSLSISLTVTDANDNSPVFVNTVFNTSIPEDFPVNSPIITFSAVDKDIGLNGKIRFKFSSRTSAKVRSILAVNESTGVLYSIRQLDYEEDEEFQFLVEVSDFGTPSQSSEAPVVISVLDINDNAPEIILTLNDEMSKLAENTEVGTFIGYVSVSDSDSGQNGRVRCEISDNHFHLLKFSAFNYYKIIINKKMDYEITREYSVNVTCSDMGIPPKSAYSLFNIKVLDVNDNPPVFSSQVINAFITENNSVGQVILKLTATDRDGPGNNEITYSILDNSFDMVTVSLQGDVTASKSYDREETLTFQFKVIARDSGSPALFSTATVAVTVGDVNDSPPYFTRSSFKMSAVEKTPKDVVIGKINAIDPDEKNEFYFSFYEENNVTDYFSVESDSGRILTNKVIDMKVGSYLEFKVVVVDPTNPSFIDYANVSVNITKDSDQPPVITFPQNDSVTVAFDTVVGSVITKVQAYDDVSGSKLTYSIHYGNEKDLFLINFISGEIIIAREITQSDVRTYEIIIGVRDAGTPRHSSFAKIFIVVKGPALATSSLNENIIIVIILICVTVVLSLAITVVICLIRKIDKNRKQRKLSQNHIKTIYTIENEEYSADDKDSGIEEERLKEMELSVDHCNSGTFEDNFSTSPARYKEHDKNFTSSGLTPRKLVHFEDNVLSSKMVDTVSDTSAGTDSGRGCSDEEIHSVRGSLQLIKHSDSIYSVASYV